MLETGSSQSIDAMKRYQWQSKLSAGFSPTETLTAPQLQCPLYGMMIWREGKIFDDIVGESLGTEWRCTPI